jgi:tetratricopeptide (TPR) repeat protein
MGFRYTLFLLFVLTLSAFPLHASLPDSLRAELAGLPDSAQVDALLKKAGGVMYRSPATARQYVQLAEEIAQKPGNNALIPKVVNQRGTLAWIEGNYKAALAEYQLAEELFREAGNPLGIAKAQNNIGLVYRDMSYFDLALESMIKAATYFEAHPDPFTLATVYNNLGNVSNGHGDDSLAAVYYRKSLGYYTQIKDTNGLSMVHNNLGLVLKSMGMDGEAKKNFEMALQGYEALDYLLGQASVLGNLASLYVSEGEFEAAESLTLKALQFGEAIPSQAEITIAHLKLAELYLKWGRYADAIVHGKASLEAGKGSAALLPEASAHEVLAVAYEKSGQWQEAFFHLKQHTIINDTIFNMGKARSMEEMRLKFETRLKDQELETYAQKQRLDQLWKWGLAVGIILLVVLGAVIYTRQRAVIRREQALQLKDREVNAAQKARSEAELKAAESERLRLQEEIQYKSKEITGLAMNIVRRNDLLEVLDRELKALRKGVDEQKLKDLSILVSQTLSLENERKEFQLYVQEAQQNFFLRLEAAYPGLTPKEKRLCAMIKLGLSSKEIAAVFNIASSSVEVARHRLRKHLNLEHDQGLKEFLEGF